MKRDALQRTNGATYQLSDGTVYDETTTLTQLGKIIGATQTYNGQSLSSNFTLDKLGRMTSATVGQTKFDYGYGTPDASCSSLTGNNINANKDSNRTSYTVTNTATNAVMSTNKYCNDLADRLISSTDTQVGIPVYDDHGNTTSLAGGGTPIVFTYNALDQNTKIQQGTNRVEYVKTPSGSILRKKEYQNSTLTKSYRYLMGGKILRSCSLTDDNTCSNTDTYLSLPGNITLTKSPSSPDPTKQIVYSLKNYHGDTALTLSAVATATSTLLAYGPFGEALITATLGALSSTVSNSSNQLMGWAASPARKTESLSLFTLPIIQMGARVYLPTLGRFLQVDPIEGGTLNPYIYVVDPINDSDYSGQFALSLFNPLAQIARALQATAQYIVAAIAAVVIAPEVIVAAAVVAVVGVGVAVGYYGGAAINSYIDRRADAKSRAKTGTDALPWAPPKASCNETGYRPAPGYPGVQLTPSTHPQSSIRNSAVASTVAELNAGVNPGGFPIFGPGYKSFDDDRYKNGQWMKYSVPYPASIFEVHYSLNESECTYSDVKATNMRIF